MKPEQIEIICPIMHPDTHIFLCIELLVQKDAVVN